MSLADDMLPEDCIELCTETIEESLKAVLANMPGPDDSPQDSAEKYAIMGKCFREIRAYTKEALKATQTGQDSAAFLLLEGKKHKPLSEFANEKIVITGPDGKTVETTFGQFEKAAEAVQADPSIVDRALGGDQ